MEITGQMCAKHRNACANRFHGNVTTHVSVAQNPLNNY